MSEATEDLSVCLAPGEGSSEPGMSHELLDRLRALEAENSALAQANENQRETYERCLDEVANHVVQALLNQKDLREECIKLKKRVYELERQNRTLSDLFHQKLQITSGSLPQLPVHPFQVLSNLSLVPHLDSMDKLSTSLPLGHCVMQKQVSPEKQQMGNVILNTPSSSMEALSPFLKKKAQILEVLRKLEEMDPLMVCPRSNPGQCFSAQNSQGMRNSCSLKYKQDGSTRHESGSPEYLNGAGFLPAGIQVPEYEPWTACLLLAPSGLEDILKWKHACSDSSGTFREEEELEETMALVQEDCRDLDGAEAELLSSRYSERKSTGSSSSSSDDNCELGEPNLLEKSPPESLLSVIAEKVAFGQLLEDTESYLYSVMKERSKRSALNGDQTSSLLCEEQISIGGKRGSDEAIPKDGFTGADPGSVSKSLEGEMPQEEKYNHTRTVNCYSQSVEGLSHHNTEDKVKEEMVNSEDINPWKETGKTVLDSTSDCSPPSKCRVNMFSQSSLENNALFSMYVSSNSLNAQQGVGEKTSTCNITEKTVHSFPSCSSQGKNELQISPGSTVDSEEHRAPQIPSPSKFLKLLKIPMVGERTQSQNHLRLSPQLTRSSKIPCRNNYEVCHSPLLRRKATVVEQVPEETSKNESLYGIPSLTVSVDSEIGFGNSSSSSLKTSRYLVPGINKAGVHDFQSFGQETQSFQKAPNYENVCFAISSVHSSPKVDQSKHFLRPTHVDNQEASQDKVDASELMESVYYSTAVCLGVPPQTTLLSDGASPSCSQGLYSSTKDKQKEKLSSESKEMKFESSQVLQRSSGSTSASKRMGGITGKKQEEPSGYLPFRERLTALGKVKSSESSLQVAEKKEALCEEKDTSPMKTNSERHRVTVRQCEINERLVNSSFLTSEASESREHPKRPPGVNSLKHQERCCSEDIEVKLYHSNSVGSKLETENYSSKIYIAKGEVSRNKVTGAFGSPGSPQASRTSAKIPITPNFCKNPKSPHGSPTKLPSKSPTKAPVKGGVSRPLSDEMRSCTRTGGSMPPPTYEEKLKIQQLNTSKKSVICPENTCQGFTRASHKAKNTDNMPLSSMLHSAIEEKVMKGIKENMLRLQEQDKVPVTEGKQKSSSSIASWFGLKKSKLPALNRRPDTFKTKDEKREWSVGSSPLRKEVKIATKKMEAESLNISMLMEKAEDLRKALEEEKAYMNGISLEKSRGIMCDTEQTQSELGVPYSKEARPDSFMQQLLNRVDGKEISSESRPEPHSEQRPLQDSKGTKVCHAPRIGIMSRLQTCEENPDQNKDVVRGEVPSDESLAESVTSQNFPACGSLTRTLDSGIGTFPPPDYCGGTPNKIVPKLKPREPLIAEKLPVLPKAPRKARTLEREVPSVEETLSAGQHQSVPAFHALLASPETALGNRVHKICKEACSRHLAQPKRIQHSNNWTFPNLKASAGSTDTFLSSSRDEEVLHSSLGSTKGSPSEAKRSSDMLHLAPHFPGSRTPSTSDVGEEGGADMRSTDTGQGQAGLENSESLSDSLYDSLSSCGSQG